MDPTDVSMWLARYDRDLSYQREWHTRWKLGTKLYSMEYWREQGYLYSLDDPITPVNYATTFVQTLVSAIFSRNPKIFIRARHNRYAQFAQTMERIHEWDWEENRIKDELIRVIIDTVCTNVGWTLNGAIVREDGDVTPGQDPNMTKLLREIESPDANEQTQSLKSKGRLHTNEHLDSIFLKRISPYDVIVPRGYSSYWELPYLIIKERIEKEDFIARADLPNKDELLDGFVRRQETDQRFPRTKRLIGPRFPGNEDENTDQFAPLELLHVWDCRSNSKFTLSPNAALPIAEPANWPYYSEGFPAIPFQFHFVPNTEEESNFYGFSDIEPIIPQVLEKSNIRTDMVEHRKRASFTVFVQKGSQDEEDLAKYADSDIMEIVPVTNIEAIKLSSPIQVPPAVLQTEAAIDSDLDRDSQLALILSNTGRSADFQRATVATIAQSNANLGTSFKIDRLESYITDIARYRTGLFWQFLTKDRVGEILGEFPSPEQWIPLPTNEQAARNRVRNELENRVEAGSTQPISNDVLDRDQFLRWMTIFQATSPVLYKRIERQLQVEMAKKFRMPMVEQLVARATDEQEMEAARRKAMLAIQGHRQVVEPCADHETHLKVYVEMAEQLKQQGQSSPELDELIIATKQALDEAQGASRLSSQGVSQGAAAPSAAEVGQRGVSEFQGIAGQANNLREGTGSVANSGF